MKASADSTNKDKSLQPWNPNIRVYIRLLQLSYPGSLLIVLVESDAYLLTYTLRLHRHPDQLVRNAHRALDVSDYYELRVLLELPQERTGDYFYPSFEDIFSVFQHDVCLAAAKQLAENLLAMPPQKTSSPSPAAFSLHPIKNRKDPKI